VDNFIACKASSLPNGLTLQSMVSKNTLEISTVSDANYGNEGWICLQSITGQGSVNNGRILLIDQGPNTYGNAGRGYFGVTESTTIYKRETIKPTLPLNSTLYSILVQGGYNISTNLIDGITFADGLSGGYVGLYRIGVTTKISHFSFVRTWNAFQNVSESGTLLFSTDCSHNNNNGICDNTDKRSIIGTVINCNNNSGYGAYYYNGVSQTSPWVMVNCNSNGSSGFYSIAVTVISDLKVNNANNNVSYGVYLQGSYCNFSNLLSASYNATGLSLSSINSNQLYNTVFTGNSTVDVSSTSTVYLKNCVLSDTEFTGAAANSRVYSTNHDNAPNNHYIYTDYGTIVSDAVFVHSTPPTGISWKYSPTNVLRSSAYPLDMVIAIIACNANSPVTVRAYFARSSQTDIGGKLICKGGQLAGVGDTLTDISSSLTCFAVNTGIPSTVRANPTVFTQTGHGLYSNDEVAFSGIVQAGWTFLNGNKYPVTKLTVDTFSIPVDSTGCAADYLNTDPGIYSPWQALTLTFTPTIAGVVEIEAHAWWIAGVADENVWVDDFSEVQGDVL